MNDDCPKPCSRILLFWSFALVALLGLRCGPNTGESPTSGNLVVFTAESVAPVMKEVTEEFNRTYKDAKISLVVSTSREAIVKLLNNEAKVVVSARELNEEERSVIVKYNLHLDTFRVAYDGIAAIVHLSNLVGYLSLEELGQIVTGKVRSWSQLFPKGKKSPEMFVAMGGPNTGIFEFVKTNIANGEPLTTQLYPCTTSAQVLDLVRGRPEVLGLIGTNWLPKDSAGINILEIGGDEYFTDAAGRQVRYFGPHPAHVYRGFYPLRRTIYIFSREKGYGLGAGFITFVTSAAGQKIILDSGLVPATMPIRLTSKSS